MGIQARNPFENDDLLKQDVGGQPLDGPGDDEPGDLGDLLESIDHVAIAVHRLDEALDGYRETFGVTVHHREILESEGIDVALLEVGGSYIQLLAPTRDDSDLVPFLEERGEGLHHIGYRVSDCAAALDLVMAQGHEVVDDEPRPGVGGASIAFIHPSSFFGTLIQLVER